MPAEITEEVDIDAPIETVFHLLATPEGLLEWIAADATIEPWSGGTIQWTHTNGETVKGEIVVIDPPTRLVFTYGWVGNPRVLPGSTEVDIKLERLQGGPRTRLTLNHRGLPDQDTTSHLAGWRHFLGRLVDRSHHPTP